MEDRVGIPGGLLYTMLQTRDFGGGVQPSQRVGAVKGPPDGAPVANSTSETSPLA